MFILNITINEDEIITTDNIKPSTQYIKTKLRKTSMIEFDEIIEKLNKHFDLEDDYDIFKIDNLNTYSELFKINNKAIQYSDTFLIVNGSLYIICFGKKNVKHENGLIINNEYKIREFITMLSFVL